MQPIKNYQSFLNEGESVYGETKPPYSEKIEVGMYVNIPSENDNTRASKRRFKVIGIKSNSKTPYLRTVALENGEEYTSYDLFYPSFGEKL